MSCPEKLRGAADLKEGEKGKWEQNGRGRGRRLDPFSRPRYRPELEALRPIRKATFLRKNHETEKSAAVPKEKEDEGGSKIEVESCSLTIGSKAGIDGNKLIASSLKSRDSVGEDLVGS